MRLKAAVIGILASKTFRLPYGHSIYCFAVDLSLPCVLLSLISCSEVATITRACRWNVITCATWDLVYTISISRGDVGLELQVRFSRRNYSRARWYFYADEVGVCRPTIGIPSTAEDDRNVERLSCCSGGRNQGSPIQAEIRRLHVEEVAGTLWLGSVSELMWWGSHGIVFLCLCSKKPKSWRLWFAFPYMAISVLFPC